MTSAIVTNIRYDIDFTGEIAELGFGGMSQTISGLTVPITEPRAMAQFIIDSIRRLSAQTAASLTEHESIDGMQLSIDIANSEIIVDDSQLALRIFDEIISLMRDEINAVMSVRTFDDGEIVAMTKAAAIDFDANDVDNEIFGDETN